MKTLVLIVDSVKNAINHLLNQIPSLSQLQNMSFVLHA